MTVEQWVRNNRGIGVDGADLPRPLLEALYAAISAHEIAMEQREYIRAPCREGWLTKQGGRIKTWKRRWVVLAAGGVLYYFDEPKAASPKGVLPLEDVVVRSSAERPFAFSLSHAEADGGLIKSAKRRGSGGSGSLIRGGHERFVFAAESEEERQRWMRALRENAIIGARFARRGQDEQS